jgi:pyruvate formate lyase activating enzyme
MLEPSRVFYPAYKLRDRPPTPAATIRHAREIGLAEGLRFVYGGNLAGERVANTYCYACESLLIERSGLSCLRIHLEDGKCPECGTRIDGVGM